jgi:polysaccharide biosynthesis PFTS motif protein
MFDSTKNTIKRHRQIRDVYNRLRDDDKLNLIESIKIEITEYYSRNQKFSLQGLNDQICSKAFAQFFFIRILNKNFNYNIYKSLKSSKPFAYPIPSDIDFILKKNGLKINYFRCRILWKTKQLEFFLRGLRRGVLNVIDFFKSKKSIIKSSNSKMFFSLGINNFPKKTVNNNYGIFNNAFLKSNNISSDFFHESKHFKNFYKSEKFNLRYLPNHLIYNLKPFELLKFFAQFLYDSIIFFLKLMFCKSDDLILFEELVNYRLASNKSFFFDEYLFNNSNVLYRPLWSYIAEKNKSLISHYFYSTNIERFKINDDNFDSDPFCWKFSTWQKFYFWDQFQLNFFKSKLNYSFKYKIVGPTLFNFTSLIKSLNFKKNTILIFDVQPVRITYYRELAFGQEYYVRDNCIKFINDICYSANKIGFKVVIKRKRNIGNMIDYIYLNNIKKLINNNLLSEVDPNIPAEFLLKSCENVICMPFTSVAIFANNLSKNVSYYDSTSKIAKDDNASHGVKILSNNAELNNWIKNIK